MNPSHPHARAAIRLADLAPRVTRHYITQRLEAGDCPRGLYVLACILRAARAVDRSRPRTTGAAIDTWI